MRSGKEAQTGGFEKIMSAAAGMAEAWNDRTDQWLRERRITFTQYRAIILLSEGERKTLSQLSQGLSRTRCAITGLVDRLEEKGLVKRKRSRKDRRMVYVALTEKGRELAEELKERVVPEITSLGERIMAALTDREVSALLNALGKLSEGIIGREAAVPKTGSE